MPIDTRNIIGVDSDKYDNRAPDRPHYNSTPYRDKKFAMPPLWVIVVFVLASLPIVGALTYGLIRLFNYIGELNYYANDYDDKLLIGVKTAFALALGVIFIGIAVLLLVFITTKMIVRLQNNMPVSVFEIVFGGAYVRELAKMTLQDYAMERRTLWENSNLWALETLDLSRSFTGKAPDVLSGDVLDVPPALPLLPSGDGGETNAEMLIRSNFINRSGNSILAGFSAHDKPHYMELNETGFVSIVGYPRVGKSATAAFIAAQTALIPGAQIFVCDKHAHRHDSLTKRLDPLADVIAVRAGDIDSIKGVIDQWYEIGRDRLLAETNDQFAPVILIIDEYTSMILLEELPEAQLRRMLSGSVEFPKVQTHGLYIAHQFTGRLMGGNLGPALRRVTTQRIVMRCDTQDAAFVMPDKKIAKLAPSLADGRAYFFGQSQSTPVEIAIPEFTSRDLAYIASVLPVARSAQTIPIGAHVSRVADVASASESAETGGNNGTNGDSANNDSDPLTGIDKYAANQAITYLSRRNGDGRYTYGIRDVQAMTGIRTAAVVALAHSIGRKRGNNDN